MRPATRCAVCFEEPRVGWVFCRKCERAFMRANVDFTHVALIEWIAARARRIERRKARGQRAATEEVKHG